MPALALLRRYGAMHLVGQRSEAYRQGRLLVAFGVQVAKDAPGGDSSIGVVAHVCRTKPTSFTLAPEDWKPADAGITPSEIERVEKQCRLVARVATRA